jgi:hypothetical protein
MVKFKLEKSPRHHLTRLLALKVNFQARNRTLRTLCPSTTTQKASCLEGLELRKFNRISLLKLRRKTDRKA